MANGRITFFYALLIAVASLAVGMVITSRLDLSPASSAQTLAAPPMNSTPISGPLDATTFREIASTVSPAVVNIRTESRQRAQELSDFFGGQGGDLFERFFGQPAPRGQQPRQRDRIVQSAGTGFIIDKAGYILTNNHVVDGTERILVTLYGEDDQEYEARVIGRDPLTDSALIELTQKPNHELPEAKFGDSSQMQPGDWVMAIGNPFGYGHTISVGVISGTARPFQMVERRFAQMLQSDAAINPGNPGGPLLNIRGEVIGINTAIVTGGRQQGNIGIGFAIPSNAVRELLPQLRTGRITRGRIGVEVTPVPREAFEQLGLGERAGALIRAVAPDSAAARAGLEPGDVVVAFNNQPVRSSDDLVQMVIATRPGTSAPVRVVRDRRERTLTITVDELDLDAESAVARGDRPGAPPPQETASQDFGVTLRNVTPDVARQLRLEAAQRGAVITAVEEQSPAARAGLAPGDVIIRIGDQTITSAADAQGELGRVPSGGTVFLRVLRNGQEQFVIVSRE